jgi:hypothetical protein
MTESLRVLLPALVGTALVGLVLQRPNVWAMTRLAVFDEPGESMAGGGQAGSGLPTPDRGRP